MPVIFFGSHFEDLRLHNLGKGGNWVLIRGEGSLPGVWLQVTGHAVPGTGKRHSQYFYPLVCFFLPSAYDFEIYRSWILQLISKVERNLAAKMFQGVLFQFSKLYTPVCNQTQQSAAGM